MGSGEEWANDAPGRGCRITLAGLVAGGVVTLIALWVLVAEGLKLL